MDPFHQTGTDVFNWQEFLGGDREALGNIFRRYFSDLFAYGLKILASDDVVKDHIQELFVRLWEKRSRLGMVRNVKVYLLISLKNDLLQSMRNKRRDRLDPAVAGSQFAISFEDLLIEKEQAAELAQKVASCLGTLTARQREVVYLRFYHNLDFPQLAEVMEMNVQSVRNLLFRTLEKLRKEVDNSGIQQCGNIELILFGLFKSTERPYYQVLLTQF
ncbi:MAG: sigma-70 family RNA polymerase sigma factor [Mangrovibacterium sp.]|nr:sigma-70 family RNA polymerase sigma factor [Mangrovibacterium sp.]